jgi:beta-phosphoglucomutase-like phosphatase (HAD superfamily)
MLIDMNSRAAGADGIRSGAVSGIIFDMDGTMIDSMPSHAQSWVAFVQKHGIDIDVPRPDAPHHRAHRRGVHARAVCSAT